MLGLEGGDVNADDPYVAHSFDNIGAAILGRNMFGTSRASNDADPARCCCPVRRGTRMLVSDPIRMAGGAMGASSLEVSSARWRRSVVTIALVLAFGVAWAGVVAASAKRPRVEDVSVQAVVLLGTDAPRAVLESLEADVGLKKIVRRIQAGTLEAPEVAPRAASPAHALLASGVPGRLQEGGSTLRLTPSDYQAIINAVTLASLDAAEADPKGVLAQEFREDVQDQVERAAAEEEVRRASIADPFRILSRAQRKGADPGAALFVNAMLLAANNGYDADQITDYLLDELLDPQLVDTDEGLLALRGPFLLGGVITGVEPNQPATDAFRVTRPVGGEGSEQQQSDGAGDRFVGELVLGANWQNSNGVGTPTVSGSRIVLRIDGERLVGTYNLELAIPPEGGANCATTATYEGKLDLPSDGPGWAGTAEGTWTWTIRSDPRCGSPPAVYGLNWTVNALRVGDDRVSGDFSAPTDGQGMTMTFEAQST